MKRLVPKISNLQRHVLPCVQCRKVICQVGPVQWNELLSFNRINNQGHCELRCHGDRRCGVPGLCIRNRPEDVRENLVLEPTPHTTHTCFHDSLQTSHSSIFLSVWPTYVLSCLSGLLTYLLKVYGHVDGLVRVSLDCSNT